MNVGIVGFGSIGTEVAKALIKGVEDFSFYGVTSRSKANALKKIAKLNKNIKIYDLDNLVDNCEIIIDCAPKEAFREIATKCINKERKLITVSGSGILDNLDLEKLAKTNKSQIILATGAILGLDALRAASESNINSVTMITRKPPNALTNAPYVINNNIQLNNLKRNTHKVQVDSDSAVFEMSIQNVQTPENPGTGKITGLSVVACLRGLKSSFKIGT
jgi:aspartate dehydrogenase